MNKKIFFIVFLMIQAVVLNAQTTDSSDVSFNYFETLKVINPWLNTTNPAGLNYNEGVLPGVINLFYGYEGGDYKRVQQGDQINHYSFQSKSFLKIKDVNLFGSFSYDKSYEKNLDFSNTNNPYRETPYDLVDTIGGDTYDREFFYLNGGISKPVGKTIIGLGVDFGVGVAVQQNDPRPQNKVLDLMITPGVIYNLSKVKLGLNFIYQYYNEEIEIDIIKQNETATMFRILGPGVYTYHEAGSFNRLYKRNSYGGAGQINYSTEKLNLILDSKLIYFDEIAQDGGKGGGASWSYIRNYSKFEGINWNVYSNTQIKKNLLIQNIELRFDLLTTRGTEIIENLEQVGDLDNEDWVFYMNEPKYGSERIGVQLNYDFIKMKSITSRNYSFKLKGKYDSYKQEYHIPDQNESYENMLFGFDASKDIYIKKSLLSITAGIDYKMNITGKQNFEEKNFIYERILYPDYEFITDNYYAPVFNFLYEQPLKKLFDKIFFDAKTKLLIGEDGRSRFIVDFSTGVIF